MNAEANRRAPRTTLDRAQIFTEEVWNRRNLEMLEELVVDDYLIRNLGDGAVAVRGRAELRHHIEEWQAAFPDLRVDEIDCIDGANA